MWYSLSMATITIRNLDETVKRDLQVRAAINGRSMEAEVRALLSELAKKGQGTAPPAEGLGTAIHRRFAAIGGVDLPIPPRQFSNRPASGRAEDHSKNEKQDEGLGTAIHKLFAPLGGVELQIPTRRKSHRPIPTFDR
jgi:plasmid stability protein